jgi:hypothetical protein
LGVEYRPFVRMLEHFFRRLHCSVTSEYAKAILAEAVDPKTVSIMDENKVVNPANLREEARVVSESKGILAKTKQARAAKGLSDPEQDAKPEVTTQDVGLFSDYSTPSREYVANSQRREAQGSYLKELVDKDRVNPEWRNPLTIESNALAAPGPKASWDESVVDFMFGGEMALLGMQYDNGAITHDWDVAKKQWSEAPVWENVLNVISLGSYAFPPARAAYLSAKFGKVGRVLGNLPSKADDVERLKAVGKLADDVTDVDDKTLKLLLQQEHNTAKHVDRASKVDMMANGEDVAPPSFMDKAKMKFDDLFANSYMDIVGGAAKGQEGARNLVNKSINDAWRREDMGKLFTNMPDYGPDDTRFYEHFLSKAGVRGAVSKLKGNDLRWADEMEALGKAHTQEALESGFMTPETIAHVTGKSGVHIPAQVKGTLMPDADTTRSLFMPTTRKATAKEVAAGAAQHGDDLTVLKSIDIPRLDSPTLKARKADLPEVHRKMLDGELITDPYNMTVRGYMTDRMLLNNYKAVTDLATRSGYGFNKADLVEKFGSVAKAEKAGYVSLENLQGEIPRTLRRMIEKKNPSALGAGGELPMMRKEVFEELFAEDGMFAQTQQAVGLFEALVSIHKTAKTGYSVPTHIQNIVSNIAMLAQRGYNFTSPSNAKVGVKSAQVVARIGEHLKAKKALGPYSLAKAIKEGPVKGINLGKYKMPNGKVLDLNDEVLNPQVMALIEESSFEMAEGHARMEKMLQNIGSQKGLTRGLLKGYQKVENLANKKFGIFEKMSHAYLAEDMVPKLSYYLDLRSKGLTAEAAVIEVGRALPMYATVGSAVRGARKVALPWASFPTEALRITKNNLMDHPLRMMPWLQAPAIMRSALAVTGQGPATRADAKEDSRSLPLWAQKQTTVMAESGLVEAAGTTAGAAGTGALMGGIFGGTTGAALGGAAGLAAGLAYNFNNEKADTEHMRGVMLDWLPHSPWTLQQVSPEATGDAVPWNNWKQAVEQNPLGKPASILLDLTNLIQGKNSYGEEMKSEGMVDSMMQMTAGMIGFLSPPLLQKYAFQVGKTPDISLVEQALGGDAPMGRQLDPTNMARLGIDSGLVIDPVTGRPGNLSFDMFMNNFTGIKSYATDPSNRLFNESLHEQHYTEQISAATRNLRAYAENGMEDETVGRLRMIQSIFAKKHSESPQLAERKYAEWLKRHLDSIGKHPRLKGWSKEELEGRITEMSRFSEEYRGRARSDMVELIKGQLALKGSGSSGTIGARPLVPQAAGGGAVGGGAVGGKGV